MHNLRHLVLFKPNPVIQLLHVCINYNYFEFANLVFQQVQETAFSPTIANVFMSVMLRKFLTTQTHQPLMLKRSIDDLFILWQHGETLLTDFLTKLNQFHPNLRFKYSYTTNQAADFLHLQKRTF